MLMDRRMNMNLRIRRVILTTVAVIVFALAAPLAFAQQDTPGKPTAKGQMKESGKEAGRAGKSLGHNVKHGRVLRGGKRFGKHIGYAGRHVGRGTKHAVKTAVKK
jgi:hypothetical protein